MRRVRVRWAAAAGGLLAAGACGGSHTGGTGGATSTSTSTSTSVATSSGAGGCPADSHTFGVCTGPGAPGGGPGQPGAPCEKDTDCAAACCPCPHGQVHYAYQSCLCGSCASVCNPVNDTLASVCQDAGGEGGAGGGCLTCAQVLNVVLVDGDPAQVGPQACQGAASAAWGALSACAAASCGSVCPGIMPTSPCVACFEKPDASGGCATEVSACQGS